ncbi:MAG: ATP-binding cassette domain-containing protein, partial [Gammaproteobacteria bacterium]|nr:ATP-binding cassette domain-containing protein [Gammaproteobacteria bacterium]
VWIRQGIKARRTRNEGRVRALKAMREVYRERRTQQGTANLQMQQAENSGKLVCEAENITYSWDGFPVVKDFSMTILRGDRIGVIGPNGAGKSTLLNLLLGKLQPQQGKVKLGTKLDMVFFDQLRDVIDDEKTVMDNVAEGSDKVEVNGKTKHIMSYLQDFLFAPQRVRQNAGALSGGERNRLLLAKLFLKPANLLVLDEPTNDLDVETLELLEELLTEYQGTLLLVSHDRQFLDNVVTSTLVLEGNGHVEHSIGGFTDWEEKHRQKQQAVKAAEKKPAPKYENSQKANLKSKHKKLSYKNQRELDELPKQIEALEKQLDEVQSQLSSPEIYKESPDRVSALQQQLADTETELEEKFQRWEELEALL